jgi:adenine-specific DNA-methyltransferase
MMEKRLKLAKELLNPQDSVLICAIDEKEYLHLGCLLEELFPDANMQMISTVTNSRGVARGNGFARTDEYLFILQIGASSVSRLPLSDEWRVNVKKDNRVTHLRWSMLIRSGSHFLRADSVNQFYPVFVNKDGKTIHSVGEPYYGSNRNEVIAPEGTVAVWPIRKDGKEGNWQISADNLRELIKQGFVMLGNKFTDTGMPIYYLKRGEIKKVKEGVYEITGHREDGSIISDTDVRSLVAGTQWRIGSHDASTGGTALIKSILGETRFTYPKSLYAVHDAIRFFVAEKPNALILDFFAGSGTTLHAVNLLNTEDGGHRRCIMVTNNEVSDAEEKNLKKEGHYPGDDEWEKFGIARYVTWPRTICSVKGHDINGEPLKGNYIGSDIPMSDGFKANCEYFKLTFLDKTSVALGRQFRELLPLFWMKGGAVGKCPALESDELPNMLILPQNKMAVLIDEIYYSEFDVELQQCPEIQTVFIVTDSEAAYRTMIRNYNGKACYQLYRDYLDNFRINTGR